MEKINNIENLITLMKDPKLLPRFFAIGMQGYYWEDGRFRTMMHIMGERHVSDMNFNRLRDHVLGYFEAGGYLGENYYMTFNDKDEMREYFVRRQRGEKI